MVVPIAQQTQDTFPSHRENLGRVLSNGGLARMGCRPTSLHIPCKAVLQPSIDLFRFYLWHQTTTDQRIPANTLLRPHGHRRNLLRHHWI